MQASAQKLSQQIADAMTAARLTGVDSSSRRASMLLAKEPEGSMSDLNRRLMLAGAAATLPALAHAQARQAAAGHAAFGDQRAAARLFGPGAPPAFSPDPDVLRVEPAFGGLLIGQEVIRRAPYRLSSGRKARPGRS